MASRAEHFQSLVRGQPGNALFRFSLAQALVAEGRPAESIEHFEVCVASSGDWMMPRILLGKVLLQLGRKSEAKPLLTEALRLAVEQVHDEPEREVRGLLEGLGD